jgi:hypothetical protein
MLLKHLDDMESTPEMQALGDRNPFQAYRYARNIFAGSVQLQEAAELGAKALNTGSLRELRKSVEDMASSEVLAFRIGMMDAIETVVSKTVTETQTPADVASKLMRTGDLQQRLSLAFKGREQETQRFLDQLRSESYMKHTYNQTRPTIGAQTGQLLAGGDQIAGQLGTAMVVADAVNGKFGGIPQALVRMFRGKRASPEVMAEVAKIVTNKDMTRRDIERIMRAGDPAIQQALGKMPFTRSATRAGVATSMEQQ